MDIATVDEESVGIPLVRLDEDSSAVEIDKSVVDFDSRRLPVRRHLRGGGVLFAEIIMRKQIQKWLDRQKCLMIYEQNEMQET